MRNLFSFNIEENSEITGVSKYAEPFVLREINDSIADNQKKIGEKMDELEKKWALPAWLGYTKVITIGFGAMLLACCLMILIGVGFGYAFSSPLFVVSFVGGIILFGFGAGCFIVEYRKKRLVENSDEYKKAMEYIDSLSKKSENYLKLPQEKTKVDIFFYPYIVRDDKIKDNSAFKYLNMSYYLFEENEKLCLANNNTVYGIDKSLFKAMMCDIKKTSFSLWNKDKPHSHEEYKKHKITLDHYGIYHVKNACSVRFETTEGEKREIVIPPYEIPHFEKILGLKVKEDEED